MSTRSTPTAASTSSGSAAGSAWRSLLTAVIETVRTRFPSLTVGGVTVADLDYPFVSDDDSYWQLLADVRNLVYVATDLMSDDEC
jgi:hypothetical protein